MRDDDIDLALDQIGRQLRIQIVFAFRPALLDHQVLALDITQIAHAGAERLETRGEARGRKAEKTDPINLGRLGENTARADEDAGAHGCQQCSTAVHVA